MSVSPSWRSASAGSQGTRRPRCRRRRRTQQRRCWRRGGQRNSAGGGRGGVEQLAGAEAEAEARAAGLVDRVSQTLDGTEPAHLDVKGVPIFKNSSGQSFVLGYLVVEYKRTLNVTSISFHCFEGMGSDLEQSSMLNTGAETSHQSGLSSKDLRRFYATLYSGLEDLHCRGRTYRR